MHISLPDALSSTKTIDLLLPQILDGRRIVHARYALEIARQKSAHQRKRPYNVWLANEV
jgi:hypothetical protein